MAGSEDGEDCAMKYLKEQQKNPAGPRKTKPRCETDAAMEYLKGQLAKQKKGTGTGRTSPKVPLPDYLKGIRLQGAAQTERRSSPERSTRPLSNPNSPAKVEAPQVRDSHFSPGSDVRKTLELIQQKVGTPQQASFGPLSPHNEVKRSASAKRLRPAHGSQPPPSPGGPLSWTTRSVRVPAQSEAHPPRPGESVPARFRELDIEKKPEIEATSSPATSWVKTYANILEKSQATQGKARLESPVRTRFESPVRRIVPGGAVATTIQPGSPIQTWRRPPQPHPAVMPIVPLVPVPVDLNSLGPGSFRLCPGDESNGYHSARIRVVPELATNTTKAVQNDESTREEPAGEPKDVEKTVAKNKEPKDCKEDVESFQENAAVSKEPAETSPIPRAALTPCNFTGASTPNPSPKKPWDGIGTVKIPDKNLEKNEKNEKTPENRPPSEKPEMPPRLVPSGAWSPAPAPGFFRLQREYVKPVHHAGGAEATGTTGATGHIGATNAMCAPAAHPSPGAACATGRIQGVSTCLTPSVLPSTPPMPMTPPLPWHRVTGFEMPVFNREHTAASASAGGSAPQWPPKVGVYRTYSVTAAVPWFPRSDQRSATCMQDRGSPFRRRQIKV